MDNRFKSRPIRVGVSLLGPDRHSYAVARGWVGVGFVDIYLVKMGGCGACGKGRNGGKRDEAVFWGDTKPVVVCGAAGWQERVD
eukprot:scaffold68547_cov59-Attheya_sp.AAC.1